MPTGQPTGVPTGLPTGQPTSLPSGQPTNVPTGHPTGLPTSQPTAQPTSRPSMQPTGQPTGQPSAHPTAQPTGHPSGQPSCMPSSRPSSHPSAQPTSCPSGQPSGAPSAQPTSQPSSVPSHHATVTPTVSPTHKRASYAPSIRGQTTSPSVTPTTMHLPTSTPSSQPTLDIVPSVPKIVGIDVISRPHNATVTVTLKAAKDSPGSVYCVALRDSNVPSSIDFVIATGVAVSYVSANKPVVLTLTGLLALKSYRTFCYTQTTTGQGLPYADVINTAKRFTTGCCQAITFVNSPTSVYGNASLYATGTSASSYMFSYALDSSPSGGSITVSPTVKQLDGTLTTFKMMPKSTLFLSSYSSSQLMGYFYFNTASSVSGDFIVSLVLTGPGSKNFTSTSTAVRLTSITGPLPAPKVIKCMFGNSGGFMMITFDTPTDLGGQTSSFFKCSLLISYPGSDVALW